MFRYVLIATLSIACTGGPIDTNVDDTDVDTGDTDTGTDTSDTGDTAFDTDDASDEDDAIFEDCTTALAGAVRLAPGNFNGSTDNWGDTFDAQCIIGGPGPDKVFAIDVPPATKLIVDFRIQGNNAKVYLLDACDMSEECSAYVDANGGNVGEHLAWPNTTDQTVTRYVVLDSLNPAEAGETWTLAVALESYTLLSVADTCGGLGTVPPITTSGTYQIAMTGFANDYNTSSNYACTGDSSAGVDGVLPVVLADGATISVTFSDPICDASVYLLEDCGDITTCEAGEDIGPGAVESFTWTNSTGHEGTFSLVLDHYHSSGSLCVPTEVDPADLEVTITPPLVVGADTCGDAELLTPLTAGQHYILTGTATDDLDLATAEASCTGQATPGDDVFLPVSVPAGMELRARYTTGSGQAALYVVTDCASADSCVEGLDEGASTQELRWVNTGGSTADVFLVVDSQYADGHASEPSSGLLDLQILVPLNDIPLADGCAQLPTTPKVGEGDHVIVMDGFLNNIDLGPGNSCTGYTTTGVDGLVQVRVRDGWTIDVLYDTGCDAALYLLTTCLNGTCLDGSDNASYSVPEHVNWLNNTGGTVDVVVGLDAYSPSCKPTRSFPALMTVDLIPPPSVAADTCAAALAKPPVPAGIHEIDLSDAAPDFDPSSIGGCGAVAASAGDEVYVPIQLESGQWVDLSFDPDAGDPNMYLLEDCDTAPVCLDGVDDGNPELLSWLNDSASTVTVVAVLDTTAPDADVAEPQAGSLEVSFQYEIVPLTASDTCGSPPITTPGRYEIDLTGFVDDIDLEDAVAAPCTDGYNTPGHDAFVNVEVPAGARLDLVWDASISTSGITNGSIYLLSACDVDTCLVGSDGGDPEAIEWTNSTGSPQTVTVGLDARSTSGVGGPNKGILTVVLTP